MSRTGTSQSQIFYSLCLTVIGQSHLSRRDLYLVQRYPSISPTWMKSNSHPFRHRPFSKRGWLLVSVISGSRIDRRQLIPFLRVLSKLGLSERYSSTEEYKGTVSPLLPPKDSNPRKESSVSVPTVTPDRLWIQLHESVIWRRREGKRF